MSHDSTPGPQQSSLPLALSVFALLGFLLFLVLITTGFFLWVVLGVFAIGAVGLLHYLFWGHALHRDTEGQREEERLREEVEADQW